QEAFIKAGRSASQTSFHENYITAEALIGLLAIGDEFHWDDNKHAVKWEGHKLKGRPEKERGDIAVFVRIQLTKEHHVYGVAYYEAKRQYYDGDKRLGFKAFDHQQLQRITKNVQAGSVVLYDADKKDGEVLRTHINALPMAFVNALVKSDPNKSLREIEGQPKLREHGRLWAISLFENLRGLGLDFNEQHVMEMRDWVQQRNGPVFVVNATVSHGLDLELTLENFLGDHYEHKIVQQPEVKRSRGIEPGGR
ncbi:MAG TPA: hypothetical protein VN028_01995, partial [Rhodocyclaceae bacterium]|nr:hypothetical protein [Rhodocyclaceae bacterium]